MSTPEDHAMLKKSKNQPDARDEELRADELGPGLYAGEVVLEIDEQDVAVSVASEWLVSGSICFTAWARPIEVDGRTLTGPANQEMEREFSFTATPALVAKHGVQALSVEVMLVVLGEPPTMVDVAVADGEEPVQAPIIALPDDVRLGVSVRQALAVIGDTSPAPSAAALLGL
jgi:hypothetical protein